MAELKTKVTKASVKNFISTVPDEAKRKDALVLLNLFESTTGQKPQMWGPTMIGFGSYHYKSTRSSQEGDWLITGFSPRKQNLALYGLLETQESVALLEKLGKHKKGVGCLYINKLSDCSLPVLTKMIQKSSTARLKKAKNAV